MSKSDNLTDFLKGVANAIRDKKGYPASQKINPQAFESEIESISTGTDTSGDTAVASDILSGKTAHAPISERVPALFSGSKIPPGLPRPHPL